ncbi:MAG: transcriptional repressor [Anaerolineae bacterium]|nr:transcriptional repressor [Anaerolineae bacterium]
MSCFEKFHELLKERGFRLTPQREAIVEALHQVQGDTVTAERIHELVGQLEPGIDLATVYRTLEMLSQIEFVKSIDSGGKVRLWQFVGAEDPHPHLLCRSCGMLFGVEPAELEQLSGQLRELYGFDIDIGQLTIPGLCPACRQGR